MELRTTPKGFNVSNHRCNLWTILLLLIAPLASAQELGDYLQIATENNPEIKAAHAEFQAAMQQAARVGGMPDPTLTISAFGHRGETMMGKQEAMFSLMQMFPWFGTLKAKKNAAALRAEANFQNYFDQKNRLIYEVSKQYYELYALQESIDFQKENSKILSDYKELALSKVSAGTGKLADVLRTEILMEEIDTKLEIIKLQKESATIQFNNLLNRNKKMEIHIPQELKIDTVQIQTVNDSIFKNHPRMLAMEKMEESADYQLKAAKKSGLPSFGLGVQYEIMSETENMHMPDNGMDMIMPMFSISLPIFRGKYKAARKEAEFMQESYRQQKTATENALSTEYAEVIFQLKKAKKMLALYQKQVKSTERILDLSLSSYQNATGDFEEILSIRQELLKYQLSLAKAESDYLTALAKFEYLTANNER